MWRFWGWILCEWKKKKKESSTFSLALWSLNLTLGLGNLGDSEHLGLSKELLHPWTV